MTSLTVPILSTIVPNMSTDKTSPADILFSKVRQRILALLYGDPDRSLHTKEIIRLSNSGNGAVQRELEAMTAAGLLTTKSIGNQKHYMANRESLLYTEIRSIVLKTFGLSSVLQQTLGPVADKIRLAFVYGSIAKQEDNVNSDIDLMLIGDNLTYADVFTLLQDAEITLGRPINPTFYSPAEWNKKLHAKNNFIAQIIKQPKIFVIGSEDELTKLG